MAITSNEYQVLLNRITAAENSLNDIFTAMENFVTLSQINQLNVGTQTELAALRIEVNALQLRVTSIEEEPLP